VRAGAGVAILAALGLLAVAPAAAKQQGGASTSSSPVALAPGGQQIATAPCPKGKHVTGGGWSDSAPYSANGTNLLGDDTGLRIVPLQSQPVTLSTWTAGAAAFTVPGTPGTYSSIARCESKSVSKIAVTAIRTDLVQPNSEGTIDTRCPGGFHVLNGGFAVSPAGDLADPGAFRAKVAESRRVSANTWEVDVVNPAGVSAAATLNTNVICELNGKGIGISERTAAAPLVDNSRATATAACTGKTHTVGGGFLVNPKVGPAVDVDQMQPSGRKGWQVGGYENPGFSLPPGSTLNAYTYCRKN